MTDYPPGPIGAALRDRAIDALGQALNASKYWLPVEGRPVAVDAVLALTTAELDASERRAITLVERIGDARNWAHQNLPPERQLALLAVLRGSQPEQTPTPSCGSCGQGPVTYYAPDGHPACADCAPCDCGTEPCSKPDAIARRATT